jgi:hypothetical protein
MLSKTFLKSKKLTAVPQIVSKVGFEFGKPLAHIILFYKIFR